jgi:hypothetical protein
VTLFALRTRDLNPVGDLEAVDDLFYPPVLADLGPSILICGMQDVMPKRRLKRHRFGAVGAFHFLDRRIERQRTAAAATLDADGDSTKTGLGTMGHAFTPRDV